MLYGRPRNCRRPRNQLNCASCIAGTAGRAAGGWRSGRGGCRSRCDGARAPPASTSPLSASCWSRTARPGRTSSLRPRRPSPAAPGRAPGRPSSARARGSGRSRARACAGSRPRRRDRAACAGATAARQPRSARREEGRVAQDVGAHQDDPAVAARVQRVVGQVGGGVGAARLAEVGDHFVDADRNLAAAPASAVA